MKNKKTLYVTVLMVLLMIVTIFTVTYSWFTVKIEGTGKPINVVVTGKLNLSLGVTGYDNTVPAPINDTDKKTKAKNITFNVSHASDSTINACYKIELVVDSIKDTYKRNDLKWEFYQVNGTSETVLKSGNTSSFTTNYIEILKENISLPLNTTHNYGFRIWLSNDPNNEQDIGILQNNNSTPGLKTHIKVTSSSQACTP